MTTRAGTEAALEPLDARMTQLHREARVLPALTPRNAASERARLVEAVRAGALATPRWELARRRVEPSAWRLLEQARELAQRVPPSLGALYLARLDELEVDLALLECIGEPSRVRPLAARRFGTGDRVVTLEDGVPARVSAVARGILERIGPCEEPREVAAEALAIEMRRAARAAGLVDLEVRIDERLVAGAATGDRSVFLAARRFGRVEARRLVAHEILGHAVAAANAAHHASRIFEIGTAGSFADQEGLALCLEEAAGALDGHRLRVLAARVLATDRLHAGASFGETARLLHRDHGFSAESAVLITERAHRGGGVARDAGYLYGYLRVRVALAEGRATVDALRIGRVGVGDLPAYEAAVRDGFATEPRLRPSLGEVLRTDAEDAAE